MRMDGQCELAARRRAGVATCRTIVGPLFIALLLSACTAPGDGAEPASAGAGLAVDSPPDSRSPAGQSVRPGIDVLLTDSLHIVRNLRVGLVTNHTGIDSEGVPTIDRLNEHPDISLVALYSPEHGIRGTAEAGIRVADEIDPGTGLSVHSLYGSTLKPTPAMLEGVDILLFDIQDIGTRYYTYVYTMALAMEAAGEIGIPFLVLDRPNPIGGVLVQGNVLEPEFASFVGMYPIPMRHGMTPGELAHLFREEFAVAVDLLVIPVDGWQREMLFTDTGLPWRAPSPNMPDIESALHYPGTCLFEGTELSVGRGTDRAFQWIGAPWLDGEELSRAMLGLDLPGVEFLPVRFTPVNPGDGKFDGVEVSGVRLVVTNPASYDPARTGVALIAEAYRLSGDHWSWRAAHFDRLAGTQQLRTGVEQGESLNDLTELWQEQLEIFGQIRSPYLLYR